MIINDKIITNKINCVFVILFVVLVLLKKNSMIFSYQTSNFTKKKPLKSTLQKVLSISTSSSSTTTSSSCSSLVQASTKMKQVIYQGVSKPIKFFQTSKELREYFELHHPSNNLTPHHNTNNNNPELWIGFYKKGINSSLSSISYQEAVDEALCFGWIDGIRKKIDDESYTNRFTPRKHKSNWSDVNIRRFTELHKLNKVHMFGQHAYLKENDEILLETIETKPIKTKIKSNNKKRPLNSE